MSTIEWLFFLVSFFVKEDRECEALISFGNTEGTDDTSCWAAHYKEWCFFPS